MSSAPPACLLVMAAQIFLSQMLQQIMQFVNTLDTLALMTIADGMNSCISTTCANIRRTVERLADDIDCSPIASWGLVTYSPKLCTDGVIVVAAVTGGRVSPPDPHAAGHSPRFADSARDANFPACHTVAVRSAHQLHPRGWTR